MKTLCARLLSFLMVVMVLMAGTTTAFASTSDGYKIPPTTLYPDTEGGLKLLKEPNGKKIAVLFPNDKVTGYIIYPDETEGAKESKFWVGIDTKYGYGYALYWGLVRPDGERAVPYKDLKKWKESEEKKDKKAEEKRKKYEELLQKAEECYAEEQSLRDEANELKEKLEGLKSEYNELKSEIKRLEKEASHLKGDDKKKAKKNIKELKAERDKMKKKISKAEKKIKSLKKEADKWKKKARSYEKKAEKLK